MTTFDPAALERRVGELNAQLSAPGFWDDPRRAAAISAEQSRSQRKLDTYNRLDAEIRDLPALLECTRAVQVHLGRPLGSHTLVAGPVVWN